MDYADIIPSVAQIEFHPLSFPLQHKHIKECHKHGICYARIFL